MYVGLKQPRGDEERYVTPARAAAKETSPVTEISIFATDISVTGMKIFPYDHSSPVTGTKRFKQNSVALTTYKPKWHNFDLVCILSLGVCELALLISKVRRLHKAVTVANNTSLCSTILVAFLEFTSVDRAEIFHMNTPQNLSR